MLLLFLVGVGMALGVLDGRSLRGPAVTVVIGFAFLVTITAVIALFIAPPGGKAAMAVAFGGFVGPAATARSRAGGIYSVAETARQTPAALRPWRYGTGRSWRWLQGLTAPMT